MECNADLGHPCDADNGEPCPSCREEEADMLAWARTVVRPETDITEELVDAGRGHLVGDPS